MSSLVIVERAMPRQRATSFYLRKDIPYAEAERVLEEQHRRSSLSQVVQVSALASLAGAIIGVLTSSTLWLQASLLPGLCLIPHIATTTLIVGAWLGGLLWNPDE
jgi:hypothetical protein